MQCLVEKHHKPVSMRGILHKILGQETSQCTSLGRVGIVNARHGIWTWYWHIQPYLLAWCMDFSLAYTTISAGMVYGLGIGIYDHTYWHGVWTSHWHTTIPAGEGVLTHWHTTISAGEGLWTSHRHIQPYLLAWYMDFSLAYNRTHWGGCMDSLAYHHTCWGGCMDFSLAYTTISAGHSIWNISPSQNILVERYNSELDKIFHEFILDFHKKAIYTPTWQHHQNMLQAIYLFIGINVLVCERCTMMNVWSTTKTKILC